MGNKRNDSNGLQAFCWGMISTSILLMIISYFTPSAVDADLLKIQHQRVAWRLYQEAGR